MRPEIGIDGAVSPDNMHSPEKQMRQLQEGSVKLAVQCLLEVVDSGAKNMEVMIVRADGRAFMEESAVDVVVKKVEEEIEANKDAKKKSTDE